MHRVAPFLSLGGLAMFLGALAAVSMITSRQRRAVVSVRVSAPRPMIEVLADREALAEATLRAAFVERGAAARASSLAERYEAIALEQQGATSIGTLHDCEQRKVG